MTAPQPAPRLLATAFGALMVAAAGAQGSPMALAAALVAAAAVVAGWVFRQAATVAVLATVVVIALSDPPPAWAALSGLAAVGYLLLRHAVGSAASTVTRPIVIGALSFSLLGGLAASIPVDVPRLPLIAPLALVAIYVLVVAPFAPRSR